MSLTTVQVYGEVVLKKLNAAAKIGAWLDRRLLPRGQEFIPGRSGMQMIPLGDTTVRARVLGDGPNTVVFVCDTPIFIEHYDQLFELLAPHMRVVCFELPGSGFSSPAPHFGFSLDEQAATTIALLDALTVRECTLAFSCVGAYLIPLVAMTRPELVRNAILIQVPSWSEELAWARRIDFNGRRWLATPVVGQLIVRLGGRAIARRWLMRAIAEPSAAAFASTTSHAFDRGASWTLASMVQAYFNGAAPLLVPLQIPTLALWGGRDRTHRGTDKESVLDLAPEAEVVYFESAGHCPELEEPERFRAVLLHLIDHQATSREDIAPSGSHVPE
jgi:pimeloyl-ACP methyl ester carboxylesterase